MIINQISIFIENRPGRLAEVMKIISDKKISIKALSIADTTKFGILRIIVDDAHAVEKYLAENDLTVSVTKVLAVRIPDVAGSMYNVVQLLADNDVSIEYVYAFISKKHNDEAYVVIRVEEEEKATKILAENGYTGIDE